jgi:hypothetical protein
MVKILKDRSGESGIWEDKNSGTIATREILSHFVPFPIVHILLVYLKSKIKKNSNYSIFP